MFSVGQIVMHYRFGLAKVESISYNQDLLGDCYNIVSFDNKTDNILVKSKEKKLRDIVTKEELENIIQRFDKLSDKIIKNKKEREIYYNNLSLFGSFEDLVIIAKRYYYFLELYHPSYITNKEKEIFEFVKKKLFSEIALVKEIKEEDVEKLLFKKEKDDLFF